MEITRKHNLQISRKRIKIPSFAITLGGLSLIAGIFNGLVGAGGGIVLSLGLTSLAGEYLGERKNVYFNSQAAMIPVSIISYLLYARGGNTSPIPLQNMLFPAIAGGIAGGIASSYINSKYIRLIFAAIVVFSGVRMILASAFDLHI